MIRFPWKRAALGPDAPAEPWPAPAVAKRARSVAPTLGHYTGTTFWRRHRRAVFLAFFGFSFLYGFAFSILAQVFIVQLLYPIALLLGAMVWLLPDTGRAPLGALRWLLFAYLVALLCWPDYLALDLPALPWISAIRLVGTPLAIILLLSLSVSSQLRSQLRRTLDATPWIWRLLVAFAVILCLTIALSKNPFTTVGRVMAAQLNWTAIFFASCIVFTARGSAWRFTYFLWGCALLIAAIGVYEIRYETVPWNGRIPSFLVVQDEMIIGILAGARRAATGLYRVHSKFGGPLGLSEFLALTMPFLVHVVMTSKRMMVRGAALVSIPFLALILLRTDSRLGILGALVGIVLYALYWAVRRWREDRQDLVAPTILYGYPIGFGLFVMSTFFIGRLRAMVWGNGPQAASDASRMEQYRLGFPKILQNPIGRGMGEGGPALGYVDGNGLLTIDTYYLAVVLDQGVLGFIAFYGMLVAAIWYAASAAIRTRDPESTLLAPIAIALVVFVMVKSVFSQQENHPLVFMMLGLLVALAARVRDEIAATAPVGSGVGSPVSSGLRSGIRSPARPLSLARSGGRSGSSTA